MAEVDQDRKKWLGMRHGTSNAGCCRCAIFPGLFAVLLANSYLTGRERQLANWPEGMTRVAVAALPLSFGAEITPDKVKFVNYPAPAIRPARP
jgi:Flp pilus assembly protein CpaB